MYVCGLIPVSLFMGNSPLPFRDRLYAHLEMMRQPTLGQSVSYPQPSDVLSNGYSHFDLLCLFVFFAAHRNSVRPSGVTARELPFASHVRCEIGERYGGLAMSARDHILRLLSLNIYDALPSVALFYHLCLILSITKRSTLG